MYVNSVHIYTFSILKYNFTVCFNIFNDKFINLCTVHTADQGKYTCMSTRAYVGTVRNIAYHIMIINRGYPFTHTQSISVVGDLVYNKMAFILTPVTPTTHTRTFKVMLLWFWNKDVGIRTMISMGLHSLSCITNV